MKKSVWLVGSAIAVTMMFCACGSAPQTVSEPAGSTLQTAPSCPAPGTAVPIKKVMSASFISDYQECDIVVEATFYKMGNEGYLLGQYDTSANTTFQVLEPGGTPGAMGYGIFAGTPKNDADVLFTFTANEKVLLRGAPIAYFDASGTLIVGVFHATSVQKAP